MSTTNKIQISSRSNFRKVQIMLRVVERFGGINSAQAEKLRATSTFLRQQQNEATMIASQEATNIRRQELADDKELTQIFEMFWYTLRPMIDPSTSVLSKEGYVKCNTMIQLALTGDAGDDAMFEIAEGDYASDTKYFGVLNKECFFDILCEVVDTWMEMIDTSSKSAFAWGLLDSIIDMTNMPPRFRKPREVNQLLAMNGVVSLQTSVLENNVYLLF